MEWETVASFSDPIKAAIVGGRLKEAGIEVFVANDVTGFIPEISGKFLDGVLLRVPKDAAEEALRLMAEWNDFGPPEEPGLV